MVINFENINRNVKILFAILADIIIFIFTICITLYLFEDLVLIDQNDFFKYIICSLIVILPVLWSFGLYRVVFRYIGLEGVIGLFKSVVVYALINYFFLKALGFYNSLQNFLLMHSMFFLILGSIVRLSSSHIFFKYISNSNIKSVMIYGAGMAGRQIAAALNVNKKYKVLGFFDDNFNFNNLSIGNLKIYHSKDIQRIVKKHKVKQIILAIPSLTSSKRHNLLKKLEKLRIQIKTLPHISKILSGAEKATKILELNISDLLVREVIDPIETLMKKAVKNKIIVVTGAGGSIGGEICRQILDYNPKKLILVDLSEAALYKIEQFLTCNRKVSQVPQRPEIVTIIGSVLNSNRMNQVISTFKPDIIYHSAAYKHVNLVERNSLEGISNNIFGTINMSKVALKNGVKHFILISTDKAVRPTNIMGASKRVAEMYIQAINEKIHDNKTYKTKFSIVRFGNVLDSSGSVVPLFKEQIKNGGPVTLTDKNVERYFMTIPEASQLVIQATSLSKGGEVFVLGMGKRIKIFDLALKMISLSGFKFKDKSNPDGDISIEFIGLRPGEKMCEELLINNKYEKTVHPRILKGNEEFIEWKKLIKKIDELKKYIDKNDIVKVRAILENIVKEYVPFYKIIDHTSVNIDHN